MESSFFSFLVLFISSVEFIMSSRSKPFVAKAINHILEKKRAKCYGKALWGHICKYKKIVLIASNPLRGSLYFLYGRYYNIIKDNLPDDHLCLFSVVFLCIISYNNKGVICQTEIWGDTIIIGSKLVVFLTEVSRTDNNIKSIKMNYSMVLLIG